MPGGFSEGMALCNGNSQGIDLANSRGTAVVCGAAAYGSYTQLVAATPTDTNFITVNVGSNAGVNTGFGGSTKIAVGASGSEKDIIVDLPIMAPGATYVYSSYAFPVSIAAGTKISAAGSGNAAADTIYVAVQLFDSNFLPATFAGVDSIGALGNGTYGTTMTAGAIGVKGAFAQLSAATARDYSALGFVLVGTTGGAGIGAARTQLDIAIGGAGSEQIIIPDWTAYPPSYILQSIFSFPIQIPGGTRIAARIACNVAGTTLGLLCYGVYQ